MSSPISSAATQTEVAGIKTERQYRAAVVTELTKFGVTARIDGDSAGEYIIVVCPSGEELQSRLTGVEGEAWAEFALNDWRSDDSPGFTGISVTLQERPFNSPYGPGADPDVMAESITELARRFKA